MNKILPVQPDIVPWRDRMDRSPVPAVSTIPVSAPFTNIAQHVVEPQALGCFCLPGCVRLDSWHYTKPWR
uniref:hypothetical protein n=1 Tax=Cephaloticoccus sp. TaxID=1985742 RepID=UPI00404AF81B